MTKIRARYGTGAYSVVSSGHAGTTQSCIAVSAIIQALAGWVHNHTGGFTMERGKALIAFPKCGGAEAVMDMTVIGLQQIERAAPDDVKVEIIYEE